MPISCESNPEVISTPMQHKKSQRYIRRRLGFLYHGTLQFVSIDRQYRLRIHTLSSATMRVMIGSEVPSWALMIAMLSSEQRLGSAGEHLQWHRARPYTIPAKGSKPHISALPQVAGHLREKERRIAPAIPKEHLSGVKRLGVPGRCSAPGKMVNERSNHWVEDLPMIDRKCPGGLKWA